MKLIGGFCPVTTADIANVEIIEHHCNRMLSLLEHTSDTADRCTSETTSTAAQCTSAGS